MYKPTSSRDDWTADGVNLVFRDSSDTVADHTDLALAGGFSEDELAEAVSAMIASGTLISGLEREWFTLSGKGRIAHDKDALDSRSLGPAFFGAKARQATVLIAIRDLEGVEDKGSGFISEDYPDSIVTAEHVVGRGNRIVKIEDANGIEICEAVGMKLGERDLDLAILRVNGLAKTTRLSVDWDEHTVEQFDDVTVFGYPSLAGRQPGVEASDAQVTAILRLAGNRRADVEASIILSARNIPGHSRGARALVERTCRRRSR